jgi:uncharacterized protein (TIGR02996 family)
MARLRPSRSVSTEGDAGVPPYPPGSFPPGTSASPAQRPEVLAFLQAIKEQPEDDTPRLVLADWLEENGGTDDQARAELIRTQVELAHLAEDDLRHAGLHRKGQELIANHAERWLGRWTQLASQWKLQRGLFHLTLGPSITWDPACQPGDPDGEEEWAWLEGLQVGRMVAPGLALLANSPLLQGITMLHLKWSPLGIEQTRQLLASPHWKRLYTLEIQDGHFGRHDLGERGLFRVWPGVRRLVFRGGFLSEGGRSLAANPHLESLLALELEGNGISPACAEALANSPFLQRLRRLHLRSNKIGDGGMHALTVSPHLTGLAVLDLSDNQITAAGLRAWTGHTFRKRLYSLTLRGNQLQDGGALTLARSPWLGQLRVLDLGSNKIGAAGARALAESPHLSQLVVLGLGLNDMGPEGTEALARSQQLGRLTTLDLSSNALGDRGCRALARSSSLERLTTLNLAGNRIGAEGIRALAHSSALPALSALDLADNQGGAASAFALAESPHLGKIRLLNLHGNGIGDKGARALASSEHLRHLLHLDISGNYIGKGGQDALRERFGVAVEL